MANRFELAGKTRARITKSKPDKKKLGQKELKDGMRQTWRLEAHASMLDKFSVNWFPFLYKAPSAPAKQDSVPGVPPKKELTPEAIAMGKFSLGYTQTGNTLILWRGVTRFELKDAIVENVYCTPKESELVIIEFDTFAWDLDEEVLGALCHLHKRETDIELTLPEPLQQDIEGNKKGGKLSAVTPIGALAGAVEKETATAS